MIDAIVLMGAALLPTPGLGKHFTGTGIDD